MSNPHRQRCSDTAPSSHFSYEICIFPLSQALLWQFQSREGRCQCHPVLLWLGWSSRSASSACSCSFCSSAFSPCGNQRCPGPWSCPGTVPAVACSGISSHWGWKKHTTERHGGKLQPSALPHQRLCNSGETILISFLKNMCWTFKNEAHVQF